MAVVDLFYSTCTMERNIYLLFSVNIHPHDIRKGVILIFPFYFVFLFHFCFRDTREDIRKTNIKNIRITINYYVKICRQSIIIFVFNRNAVYLNFFVAQWKI